MTRPHPHDTGELDGADPNEDASDNPANYEFTLADYDRTKDAYMEAITAQHDGGVTPLANRWVKFFNCVRQVIANGGSYNALEVLKALESTIEMRDRLMRLYSNSVCRVIDLTTKRRRALLWLVAERKRRRDAEADLDDAAEVDSLKYREAAE